MSTGPEHYTEAERLLALAKAVNTALVGDLMSPDELQVRIGEIANMTQLGQAHATLALAAASAQNIRRNGPVGIATTGWEDVLSGAQVVVPEHEEALQEIGRLRARVEELEAAARVVVELYVEADLTDTHPVWPLRLAFGLDGATGARDVHADGQA